MTFKAVSGFSDYKVASHGVFVLRLVRDLKQKPPLGLFGRRA